MARFHFVEDYTNHVRDLLNIYPRDEAMSLAVGGEWVRLGEMLADFMIHQKVSNGSSVLDFGCGSGRLAYFLSRKIDLDLYVGVDIVEELLDYASEKVNLPNYRFVLNHALTLPSDLGKFDYICCFSVFTHLLQTEIFNYLTSMRALLSSNGRIIFSILEFDHHWKVFEQSCFAHKEHGAPHPHLNMFLERHQVNLMLDHLGCSKTAFIDPEDGIGQTIVIAEFR